MTRLDMASERLATALTALEGGDRPLGAARARAGRAVDGPAHRRPPLRLRRRLEQGHAGHRPERRDVPHRLVRVAGATRDEPVLEPPRSRPRHKWHYRETTDLTRLAAAYGFGLCRNHPYRDGNKRVAFVVMTVFLDLKGMALKADDADVVTVMLALADGKLSERALAAWLAEHSRKTRGPRAV